MQLREVATRLLHADTLAGKMWWPTGEVLDTDRGAPTAWRDPSRPPELQIASRGDRKRMPAPGALHDPMMRARALHTFANHELMAIELMAWALLAYPEADAAFRRGLVRILRDEQRHLAMYVERLRDLGVAFGDLPVNDHFWRCAPSLTTPLKWVCAMNLVFEQANLDHAPIFASHFDRVEDTASAELMRQIERDEIHHVGFGARFLASNTPAGRATFDVWVENLTFHNTPDRAAGATFNGEARRASGLDDDFIARLATLG